MSQRAKQHRARLALLAGQGSFDRGIPISTTISTSPVRSNHKQSTRHASFFPPIASQDHLNYETASHTVEGIGNFRTRADARAYNTQTSVRGKKVDRQLNAMGYMSKRQKEQGQVAIPVVSQALKAREPRKKKLVLSKPPETVTETRRRKTKAVMLSMLKRWRRLGWKRWINWQDIHSRRYGPDARISKVNQLNEHVLALNRKNSTHHDLPGGGLKSGDIVLFRCIEAPVDGPLRPTHVIEPNYTSWSTRTVLLIGVVDGGKAAKASQQRRGHGNEALIPITFWTRDPSYPVNSYEETVHERFIRKTKTFTTFLLDNVVQTDDLEFPEERLKMPKGWTYGCNEEELAMLNQQNGENAFEDDEESSDSDDDLFVSAVQKSKWILSTVLVPDSSVWKRSKYKYMTMDVGVQRMRHIQTRWAWQTYTRQIIKQRRADSRDGAATIVQQYVRAYQGRNLARHLYRRAVRRDRRKMRAGRRVARMARLELQQRLNKRDWRKDGITMDGIKFHRTLADMGLDWHKKQVSASILIPFIHDTRLDWLADFFYRWHDEKKKFVARLQKEEQQKEDACKLSGADMAAIFEREHAKDFDAQGRISSKWDDTPEHPPWHPGENFFSVLVSFCCCFPFVFFFLVIFYFFLLFS